LTAELRPVAEQASGHAIETAGIAVTGRGKSAARRLGGGAWIALLLAILSFLVVYPVLMLLLGALTDTNPVIDGFGSFRLSLDNFTKVLGNPNVADAMLNVIRAAARLGEFQTADAEELIRYATRRNLVGNEEGERVLIEVREALQRRAEKAAEKGKAHAAAVKHKAKPKPKPKPKHAVKKVPKKKR